jgi:hypothetical protein
MVRAFYDALHFQYFHAAELLERSGRAHAGRSVAAERMNAST